MKIREFRVQVGGDPNCPICHRKDMVAGYKVCDADGVWAHRCGNKEHGLFRHADHPGDHEWPYPLYFDETGAIETQFGDVRLQRQEMQELKE